MIEKIKKRYRKKSFDSGFLGIFINLFYFARKGLHDHIQQAAHHVSGKALDVGCGQKPYRSIFQNVTEYIGMDIEESGHDHSNENIDVFYDGKIFPFEDDVFDSIVCNQVLEHVFNPVEFLSEMYRVLKKGGKVLLTVPFVWDEHEQPYDYARYSSFGLRHLVESAGFTVVEQRKSVQDIRAVFQLLNAYWYKKTANIKPSFLRFVLNILIATPNNLMGLLWYSILPKNPDFYLDNVIVLEK